MATTTMLRTNRSTESPLRGIADQIENDEMNALRKEGAELNLDRQKAQKMYDDGYRTYFQALYNGEDTSKLKKDNIPAIAMANATADFIDIKAKQRAGKRDDAQTNQEEMMAYVMENWEGQDQASIERLGKSWRDQKFGKEGKMDSYNALAYRDGLTKLLSKTTEDMKKSKEFQESAFNMALSKRQEFVAMLNAAGDNEAQRNAALGSIAEIETAENHRYGVHEAYKYNPANQEGQQWEVYKVSDNGVLTGLLRKEAAPSTESYMSDIQALEAGTDSRAAEREMVKLITRTQRNQEAWTKGRREIVTLNDGTELLRAKILTKSGREAYTYVDPETNMKINVPEAVQTGEGIKSIRTELAPDKIAEIRANAFKKASARYVKLQGDTELGMLFEETINGAPDEKRAMELQEKIDKFHDGMTPEQQSVFMSMYKDELNRDMLFYEEYNKDLYKYHNKAMGDVWRLSEIIKNDGASPDQNKQLMKQKIQEFWKKTKEPGSNIKSDKDVTRYRNEVLELMKQHMTDSEEAEYWSFLEKEFKPKPVARVEGAKSEDQKYVEEALGLYKKGGAEAVFAGTDSSWKESMKTKEPTGVALSKAGTSGGPPENAATKTIMGIGGSLGEMALEGLPKKGEFSGSKEAQALRGLGNIIKGEYKKGLEGY